MEDSWAVVENKQQGEEDSTEQQSDRLQKDGSEEDEFEVLQDHSDVEEESHRSADVHNSENDEIRLTSASPDEAKDDQPEAKEDEKDGIVETKGEETVMADDKDKSTSAVQNTVEDLKASAEPENRKETDGSEEDDASKERMEVSSTDVEVKAGQPEKGVTDDADKEVLEPDKDVLKALIKMMVSSPVLMIFVLAVYLSLLIGFSIGYWSAKPALLVHQSPHNTCSTKDCDCTQWKSQLAALKESLANAGASKKEFRQLESQLEALKESLANSTAAVSECQQGRKSDGEALGLEKGRSELWKEQFMKIRGSLEEMEANPDFDACFRKAGNVAKEQFRRIPELLVKSKEVLGDGAKLVSDSVKHVWNKAKNGFGKKDGNDEKWKEEMEEKELREKKEKEQREKERKEAEEKERKENEEKEKEEKDDLVRSCVKWGRNGKCKKWKEEIGDDWTKYTLKHLKEIIKSGGDRGKGCSRKGHKRGCGGRGRPGRGRGHKHGRKHRHGVFGQP